MSKINLGHINFLNCLPLTYSFEKENFARGMAVHYAVPSVLNSDIINGRLDISPVSSIVYARKNEKLLIMPDVAIVADGSVQSIILVSKKPIEELSSDKIILTAKSETSHCLLKIVLNKAYGARPNYYIRIVDMNRIIPDDATATLLIGDDALYTYHHKEDGLYYYDIGLEWKKLTGLRMVYAVWVINKSFAAEKPELLQMAYDKITRGFRNGYRKKMKAIQWVAGDKPFTLEEMAEYMEIIKWDFKQEEYDALMTFYELAHDMNLIDHVPELNIAEVIR